MDKSMSLPEAASVVVIGGGVMGCSVLYHLAKMGVKDVVLLERKQLTCGTTGHSAAQVRQLRSSNNMTELIKYSTELYAGLEAETGQSTGWIKTGSLVLATNEDRFTFIKRQASLAKLFNVETHIIDQSEAAEMWPMMNADDVVGAIYSPDDGRVNPSDLCVALIKGAKANGARVFEDSEVTGFDIENGRVAAVRTEHGDIKCEKVVNCAGLWGRRIGEMAGVTVPLYACEHFYLLTKAIKGMGAHLPTLADHDNYLYMRDEVGGLLAGCFEPNAKGIALDKLPHDFAFDLLNEDWDHFEPMMINALHRIPALETAEVRMLLNGPESFTPDGNFLIGEAPEVGGFFVGCGMNSVGIAAGGGMGKALAQWVVADEAPMDLWSVDIRRFARFSANERMLSKRVPEMMGLHYVVGYPGRELESARGVRRSALHDRLAQSGAQFGLRMGWERADWFAEDGDPVPPPLKYGEPGWHDAVGRECFAARNGVALFDQSSFAKLLLQGPDAEAVLQRLCANNVAVEPGQVVYTAMLNDRGGMESDFTAFRLAGDRYMLITGSSQPVRDKNWIEKNLLDGEFVTLTDITSSLAVLSIMGPKSRTLLQRLTDTDMGNDTFPMFTSREISLGYATVRAARLSYVGELGWELYVPVEMAAGLYDELMAAGEDLGLRNAGMLALGSLRVEKGYRSWGHDITPDETPLEAGLGFAVKLKTDIAFKGRQAIEEQKQEGLNQRLVHFKVVDPSLHLLGHEPILQHDKVIGQVTSAAYSHTLGACAAMGYIQLNGKNPGQIIGEGNFKIEYAAKTYPAEAALEPLFDPKGEHIRC